MTGPADTITSPQWSHLDVAAFRGTLLLVGASDTGKSVLARHLYGQLCQAGVQAAYLDDDVGQSTLGMPTTMTVALAAAPGDARFPPRGPRATYFVGSITPRGHMLPTVTGAFRLREKALALGAEAVVVDTTGLVDAAEGGRALKQWKIELLAPDLIVALQRDRELEPILWPLRRDVRRRLVEWSVSPHAVERSREARIERRRGQLDRYFEQARPLALDLRQIAVYDLGLLAVGTIVALQDGEGFALSLGIVEQADHRRGTAIVHTPLPGLQAVASLRCGALRWDLANRREMPPGVKPY